MSQYLLVTHHTTHHNRNSLWKTWFFQLVEKLDHCKRKGFPLCYPALKQTTQKVLGSKEKKATYTSFNKNCFCSIWDNFNPQKINGNDVVDSDMFWKIRKQVVVYFHWTPHESSHEMWECIRIFSSCEGSTFKREYYTCCHKIFWKWAALQLSYSCCSSLLEYLIVYWAKEEGQE